LLFLFFFFSFLDSSLLASLRSWVFCLRSNKSD
jgi:hypothetical protein